MYQPFLLVSRTCRLRADSANHSCGVYVAWADASAGRMRRLGGGVAMAYAWPGGCKSRKFRYAPSFTCKPRPWASRSWVKALFISWAPLKIATVADLRTFCACLCTFQFINSACFTFLNSCTMSRCIGICCFQLVLFSIIIVSCHFVIPSSISLCILIMLK